MSIEIIAEVAQGFEGDPKLAELLALGAVRSGADAVKYQLVFADELAIPKYQYYDFFKSLEMNDAVWRHIVEFIQLQEKKVYFDVYGDRSLDVAGLLGASGVKISTTDFYNKPLVKRAVATFERVFISIGGIPIEDVDELVNNLGQNSHVTLMYGFQAEPTPIEENNLLRIVEFKKHYPGVPIGFMDHSSGATDEAFYLPIMALSLGVNCVEKHITLDRMLEIEDYVSALEPSRFEKFVKIIRTMEKALGNAEFSLTAKEKEYKNRAGKVVVAKRDIQAGEILKEHDLTLKRVSVDGLADCFQKISEVSGKKTSRNLPVNAAITKDVI